MLNRTNLINCFEYLPFELLVYLVNFFPEKDVLINTRSLVVTSKFFYQSFQPHLDGYALLKAVMDDDRETVQTLSDKNPNLLVNKIFFKKPIESQKTRQCFFPKKPLVLAILRNQIGMAEFLLDLLRKREDGIEQALNQWEEADRLKKPLEIDFSPVIDALKKDPFVCSYTRDYYSPVALETKMNEDTKKALDVFRKKASQCLNIEALLYEAYKSYAIAKKEFNGSQKVLFNVCVIGFVQRLLHLEVARLFCDGFIRNVINPRHPSSLMIIDYSNRRGLESIPFYSSELGSKFLCDINGGGTALGDNDEMDPAAWFKEYLDQKEKDFGKLRDEVQSKKSLSQHRGNV